MAATQHPRARASPGVLSEISGAAAIALRDAGFDAKYMKGGHSAWKAIGRVPWLRAAHELCSPSLEAGMMSEAITNPLREAKPPSH